MSDVTEQELKMAVMRADLELKQKQSRWETPRSLAMILLAVAALAATSHLVDWLMPPRTQTITVHLDAPLFAAPQK